jgi:hypothetical protein
MMNRNGKAAGRGKGKPAGGAAKRKRSAGESPRIAAKEEREAEADGAVDRLDQTAAAWVTAIRARVKELAEALGRLDYVSSHPDDVFAAKMLRTVLDDRALGRLVTAVNDAECALDDLLSADFSGPVPDLADACREAAKALADSLSEGRP